MEKIKVIHLVTTLGAGGAEKVIHDLIQHHDREKFEVQVVALGKETDLLDKFEKLGVNIDICLLYTSPSPRDRQKSRMPSSA